MDYENMTAPCGLDCFNCPVYLAAGNEELRAKIAAATGVPVESVVCRGCREEGGTIPFLGMSEPCNTYRCAAGRDVAFCCDCPDFPCDNLHPYADRASQVPHNTKVFNLCLIKRMGLQAWAESKAKSVKQTYYKGTLRL